ncbi:MAG: regulatory protein RecX [Vicinamibacterales bacterium]
MPDSAYIAALKMLGGRELSERQVRQRLARRGYDEEAIDAAVARLKNDGSLDDERAARAMAHAETSLRKRGRLRVTRRLESAGIAPDVAQRATQEIFQTVDADTLMEAALQKRLRGRERIAGDREFQRLYRYLIGQGFESDRVLALLRRHKGHEE